MAKLEVEIIKTRSIGSVYAYATRIRIGRKLEMAIKEPEADEFIKKFDLIGQPAIPTDLKLNKKRFFDIKFI